MNDKEYRQQRLREIMDASMRHDGFPRRADELIEPDDILLTPRERAVAREAAEMAVAKLADTFYKQIGKTFVTKVLVWVGMTVTGFLIGRFGISFFNGN